MSAVLQWGGLHVEFTPGEDRRGHTVYWVPGSDQAQAVPLLRSVEGNPRQPWPPSPVIQHLVDHSRQLGRPLLLGIGMTASAHFSLALSAEAAGELRWEVAARCNSRPQKLGSRYEVLVPWEAMGPQELRLCLPAAETSLPEKEPPRLVLSLEQQPACRTAWQQTRQGHLLLHPASVAEEFPETVRWGFSLRVS